jgi:hypothetical protein
MAALVEGHIDAEQSGEKQTSEQEAPALVETKKGKLKLMRVKDGCAHKGLAKSRAQGAAGGAEETRNQVGVSACSLCV